jgi:hypothetical protein
MLASVVVFALSVAALAQTTATVTSKPSALQAAIAACATLSASCSEMFRSIRTCASAHIGASATIAATTNVDLSCTTSLLHQIAMEACVRV